MATSDERREVAENLRRLTIGHSIQYKEQFFDELAEVVVGFDDYHDFDVVLGKLADLIDPTCRNISDDHFRNFKCSECGCFWPNFFLEGHNCCPSCGARVVR